MLSHIGPHGFVMTEGKKAAGPAALECPQPNRRTLPQTRTVLARFWLCVRVRFRVAHLAGVTGCHAGGRQCQGRLAAFWGCWLQPLEPALTCMPCTSCRSSSRSLSSQCRYPHAPSFFNHNNFLQSQYTCCISWRVACCVHRQATLLHMQHWFMRLLTWCLLCCM